MIGKRVLRVQEKFNENGIVRMDIKSASTVIGTFQKTKEIYLIDLVIPSTNFHMNQYERLHAAEK